MQSNVFTAVFMPLALGVIMLGLGLSLTGADFKRVFQMPKPVLIGLSVQMLLLPAVCFGIAAGMGLPPELAVGLMLLAASPGGATANLFSHLANGDVALNITLTAINSIASLFVMPLIIGVSIQHFMGAERAIPLQAGKFIEVCAIVLIPVFIGMTIRARNLNFALRLEKPVKVLSALFLLLVILAAVLKEKDNIGGYFQQVGLAALLFNLASLGIGYAVPRLLQLSRRQSTAIGMEIGIHNGTLAIAVATNVLDNTVMSIPPAVYSLIMFWTAGAMGYYLNRQNTAEQVAT